LSPPVVDGDQAQAPKEPGDSGVKPAGAEPTTAGTPGEPAAVGPQPNAAPRSPGRRASTDRTTPLNANGIDADQLGKIQTSLDLQNLLGGRDGQGPAIGFGSEFDGRSPSVTNLADAIQNMNSTDDGTGQGTYSTISAPALDRVAVGPVGDDHGTANGTATVPGHDVATEQAPHADIIPGRVRVQNPTPEASPGTMTAHAFQAVFARKRAAIEACYNNALVRDPTLAGDLVFLAVINLQGQVRVEVQQNERRLDVAGVTDCIARKLGTMNFTASPPVGGDFRVRLPFSFIAP
jgi:hypothetical protein